MKIIKIVITTGFFIIFISLCGCIRISNSNNSSDNTNNPLANTKWQREEVYIDDFVIYGKVTIIFGQTSFAISGGTDFPFSSGSYEVNGDSVNFIFGIIGGNDIELIGALIGDTLTAFNIEFKHIE